MTLLLQSQKCWVEVPALQHTFMHGAEQAVFTDKHQLAKQKQARQTTKKNVPKTINMSHEESLPSVRNEIITQSIVWVSF